MFHIQLIMLGSSFEMPFEIHLLKSSGSRLMKHSQTVSKLKIQDLEIPYKDLLSHNILSFTF